MTSRTDAFVYPLTGRTGLGNMLFSWARAEVLAQEHGWGMLAPRWVKPKIGPLLRAEKDARYYLGLFSSSGYIRGLRRHALLWSRPRIDEGDAAAIGLLVQGLDRRGPIVITRGMGALFAPLLPHQELLRARFRSMLSRKIDALIADHGERYISVHVRRSDFKDLGASHAPGPDSANCRIPDSWYVRCIDQLRSALPGVPVRIFSDARPSELGAMLATPGASMAEPAPAPVDLLRIGRGLALVGSSGSSFSLWSAFLGGAPVVWHPSHAKLRLFDGTQECDTDPQGVIPEVFLARLRGCPPVCP